MLLGDAFGGHAKVLLKLGTVMGNHTFFCFWLKVFAETGAPYPVSCCSSFGEKYCA